MGSLQDLINRKGNLESESSLRPKNTKKGFDTLFEQDEIQVLDKPDPKILNRINEATNTNQITSNIDERIKLEIKKSNFDSVNPIHSHPLPQKPSSEDTSIKEDSLKATATSRVQVPSKLTDPSRLKATSNMTATYNYEETKNLISYLTSKKKSFYDLTKGQYKLLEFIFEYVGINSLGQFISTSDFLRNGFNNGRLNNELKGLREMGLIDFELRFNPDTKQKTNFYRLK